MKAIIAGIIALVGAVFLTSCNDKPDIRQAYDFHLSTWHLQKQAKPGEEVEIRFTLTRGGDYDKTAYFLAYVQVEGKGEVYDRGNQVLINREYHALSTIAGLDTSDPQRQVFTLFYRNLSEKKAQLRFVVIDNFGQERELYVTFDPDTAKDES